MQRSLVGWPESGPFARQSLIALLEAAPAAGRRVWSLNAGHAARILIPPLRAGGHMLRAMGGTQMQPDVGSYDSVIPWTCAFREVAVHGPRGVVRMGDVVVADTLPAHDDGISHRPLPDGRVMLASGGTVRCLAGTTLSLLGPNPENYYHWTIDGLGRLAALPADALAAGKHILVPRLTKRFQLDSLALCGILQDRVVQVSDGDQIETAALRVPWSLVGESLPHPSLFDFFGRLAGQVAKADQPGPRRLYLDRRAGSNRRLQNETAVIAALAPLGFVAVRLEALSLAAQITLFRDAACVVAPHGAGLTNIVYANPKCRLIELQMDTYVHWIFRRLAALRGISYDCVIGRQERDAAPGRTVHGQRWSISITHLLAAVQQALDEDGTPV